MDWTPADIGFERDGFKIEGHDVWQELWRDTKGRVQLAHLAYPNQIHSFNVYEIGNEQSPMRFAATELSNGVWGFYIPRT